MVGSYVPATTRQLARLAEVEGLLQIELRVDQVLSARRHQTLADVSRIVATALSAGQDVVVFTSRGQVNADSPAASLQSGRRISEALVELLRSLEVRPKYVIAKGHYFKRSGHTRARREAGDGPRTSYPGRTRLASRSGIQISRAHLCGFSGKCRWGESAG